MEKKTLVSLIGGTIAGILLLIILVAALVKKYTPSEEVMPLSEYYDIAKSEAMVLFENERYTKNAKVTEQGIYLDYLTVLTYINDDFYFDEAEALLTYTTPTEILRIPLGSTSYLRNGEKVETGTVIFMKEGTEYYLLLSFIDAVSDVTYTYYEQPNRLMFTVRYGAYLFYDVKKDTSLRVKDDVQSAILTQVSAGTKLWYVGQTKTSGKRFAKVMTQDGIIGYVQKKCLSDVYEDILVKSTASAEYTHIVFEEEVVLGWHMVTTPEANRQLKKVTEQATALTVISPTWFRIISEEGAISSLADEAYVAEAHAMGLAVWTLVDNFDNSVENIALFSSTSARQTLILNLLAELKRVGADGINIDFETINAACGVHYVQFLKELSVYCRQEGIVLSVDNYVPASYNTHYDLATQSDLADYIIIMAYDEHYSGSEQAGSVASIGFVRTAAANTLQYVPADRILMGVPFYTRLWMEATENYTQKLTSEVVPMYAAQNLLDKNGITPVWDAETMQYYAEYEANGAVYKIWLENYASVSAKRNVIKEYQLGGTAVWRLGLEEPNVWLLFQSDSAE